MARFQDDSKTMETRAFLSDFAIHECAEKIKDNKFLILPVKYCLTFVSRALIGPLSFPGSSPGQDLFRTSKLFYYISYRYEIMQYEND